MSDFLFAVKKTLAYEGGLTRDHAGLTNRGVVLRALKEMGAWGDFDFDGDTDEADLRAMTLERAIEFYRIRYWEPGKFDRIDSRMVAWKVFDLSVNMGPHQAALILQRALNLCGFDIAVDGNIGPQTIRATDGCNWIMLLDAMRQEAQKTYERIILTNATFEKYRVGWMERAKA